MLPKRGRDAAQLVTEARKPRSEDIAYRERRYLIMMAFRVGCFVLTIALFAAGAGWLAPPVRKHHSEVRDYQRADRGNGREPSSTRGFRAYEPNLPQRYSPPGGDVPSPGQQGDDHPARPGQE